MSTALEVARALVLHGWPFYGVVLMVAGYEWITRPGRSDKT